MSTPQTRPKWAGELTYTLPGPLVRPAIWFLGYKQVAPLGQGYRMEVDLVAQGMFMGRTDGETGWGILGYKQVAPLGQGYRTQVDLVAQGMFMGHTDGETGRGISGLQTGCPAGARVSNGG